METTQSYVKKPGGVLLHLIARRTEDGSYVSVEDLEREVAGLEKEGVLPAYLNEHTGDYPNLSYFQDDLIVLKDMGCIEKTDRFRKVRVTEKGRLFVEKFPLLPTTYEGLKKHFQKEPQISE